MRCLPLAAVEDVERARSWWEMELVARIQVGLNRLQCDMMHAQQNVEIVAQEGATMPCLLVELVGIQWEGEKKSSFR